jgi:phage gp46-like protein
MTITFTVDRYQGDPKLILDENGANMVFKAGQPLMDGGLENTVFISLFTRRRDPTTNKQWCGNSLFDSPSQRIGGRFMEKADQSVTLSMLLDLEAAAKSDLQWMINEQIATEITASASVPTGKNVHVLIGIKPPGRSLQQLIVLKYGNNWVIQALDPAHKRV